MRSIPPGDRACEATTDQGPNDRSDTEYHPKQALEHGALVQRDHGNQDEHTPTEDAGGPEACDDTSGYEGARAGGSATYGGAGLKDDDADQERPFHMVEFIDAPEEELESRAGEHVRRAIPTNVAQTLKLVRDARNGGGDDGPVQGDKEEG